MKIKEQIKGNYLYLLIILALYFIGAVLLLSRGLILSADTVGYKHYYSSQPPLYPLLIKICSVFSGSAYEYVLLSIQIILGFIGITAFSIFLYKHFSLNKWIVPLLSILLFEPYVFLYIGNYNATEALAYPLFLFTLRYLLEWIRCREIRKFNLALVFLSLLLLTRSQFLFLYPVIALAVLYFIFFGKMAKRQILQIVFIFLAFLSGNFLLERSYHYIRSGSFSRPYSGFQIAPHAFYVSNLQDSVIFSDRRERAIFIEIAKAAESKHLTRSSVENASINHYNASYFSLYVTIMESLYGFYNQGKAEDSLALKKMYNYKYLRDKHFLADMGAISGSISKKLLITNWRTFLKVYFKSIFYKLYYPIGLIRGILIVTGLILLFLMGWRTNIIVTLLFIVCCHLANLLLIATVEHLLERFTYYTEVMLVVIFAGTLFSFLDKKIAGGDHLTGPDLKSTLSG